MDLDIQRGSALLDSLRGWASAVEAALLDASLTPARRKQLLRTLQRPETLQVLLTLANDTAARESGLSLNRLAILNWPHRVAPMSNNMRSITLPALAARGWIAGYQVQQNSGAIRHALKLSEAGAEVLASYLMTRNQS